MDRVSLGSKCWVLIEASPSGSTTRVAAAKAVSVEFCLRQTVNLRIQELLCKAKPRIQAVMDYASVTRWNKEEIRCSVSMWFLRFGVTASVVICARQEAGDDRIK
jgi:hypothetical protein